MKGECAHSFEYSIDECRDDAAKIMRGQRITFTDAEEHKVLRKIDWR